MYSIIVLPFTWQERRQHSGTDNVQSVRAVHYDTSHYQMITVVTERASVTKQATHNIHTKRF
jgi:hypothetical protein